MDNALEAVEVRLGGGDATLFVVRCATELPVGETVGSARAIIYRYGPDGAMPVLAISLRYNY